MASVDVTTNSLDGELALLTMTPGKVDNAANPEPWRSGDPLTLQIAYLAGGSILGPKDASVGGYGDAAIAGPGPRWSSWFRISGDPRAWPVGEVTVRQMSLDEHYYMDNGGFTLMNGNPADMHLVVVEAVGEATSFPTVVTSDFLRVFRLDYTGVPDDSSGTQAHLSLTFVLTPADFSIQREICALCG